VVLALGGCFIVTEAAMAQINPFGRSDTVPLDSDDIQIMRSAATKLTLNNAAIGQTETWQNPKSGRSGSVSLLQTFKKNGMLCQKRRYFVDQTVNSQASQYVMTLCRLPTGEWKLA
jgi:surface antigen